MEVPPIVQVRDLTKRFPADRGADGGRAGGGGDFVAVDGVSLDVAAGEFLALLGPSGCGKTTLLRVIAGFERPDAGAVLIDGRDVTADPPNRRPVNLVFQHYALFPHLTVAGNVGFGLRYQGATGDEARRRVSEALDQVRLTGMDGRYPHQLSGGQRQRVALARALVLRPRVLLLDEPLSALDQKLRREMQVELKHLQRTVGITFVFVTHDQEEALVMSDRVGVMNAGRLEQLDAAATVFERPRTEFVARFMGAANFFARDGRRFVVRPERLRLTPAGGDGGLPVVVAERIYQGATTTWAVRDAAGTRYDVVAPTAAAATLREGGTAVLAWDPNDEVTIER